MIRVQRQRTKGWRMPAGARYVGRGSRWGNPYLPDRAIPAADVWEVTQDRAAVLVAYRAWIRGHLEQNPAFLEPLRAATALACWCPLDVRCHADVLIEHLTATEGDLVRAGRRAPTVYFQDESHVWPIKSEGSR